MRTTFLWIAAIALLGCPQGREVVVPEAICGNGTIDADETCDEGLDNSDNGACTTACVPAACGDGLLYDGVETCDEGSANNDAGACTSICTVAVCGDGFVRSGDEECDDGDDNADTAGCTSECKVAVCGDGLIYGGVEECDEGTANNDAGSCTSICSVAVCGDGFVQAGVEQCDLGDENGGPLCTEDCELGSCGDGVLDAQVEECDDGDANDDNGACTTQCTLAACGDGFVQTGVEGCDDGAMNADDAACTASCEVAFCGDGLVQAGVEACDDGAANDDEAGCTSQCVAAACSDGFTWQGVEECDDGNIEGGDGCGPTCRLPRSVSASTADARLVGEEAGDIARFVTPAGDVNNDGLADILVYAPGVDVGSSPMGTAVYLVQSPVSGTRDLSSADATFFGSNNLYVPGFGLDVRGLGDLDNDGFDDFGMTQVTNPSNVLIAYGPILGDFQIADLTDRIVGDLGASTGQGFAPAGDLDGDGNDDILVGEFTQDFGVGSVSIVYGPVIGDVSLTGAVRMFGENSGDEAGRKVASGDVSGDGVTDFIIGAPGRDLGGDDAGIVYVVEGPVTSDFDLSIAQGKLVGEGEDDAAGLRLDFAGDVNNDGFGDVLVGGNFNGPNSQGAAYLVYGPINGTIDLANADAVFRGVDFGDRAGWAVSAAGDVNGDGYDDLLVGARYSDANGVFSGEAYLVFGPVSGIQSLTDADVTFSAVAEGDEIGSSLAGVGDVDGDGLDDIVIGSVADDGGDGAGVAYVFYGSSL